jgi:hypothetical protein
MSENMAEQRFLTARMDADGGLEIGADQARVPWWSFTKTALAVAALQLVARGYLRLDDRMAGRPIRCASWRTVPEFQTTAIFGPV